MTAVDRYESVLHDVMERKVDVLIGTQMIAKGLDFPGVSFVGVVNADTSMAVPDFRAAERTFQMVTQVAGRAGRAESAGRVLIQSLAGMSPPLQFATNHDFPNFAAHELAIRKRLGWPPFTRLARVVISHNSKMRADEEIRTLADRVRGLLSDKALAADVLGPQSAPLSRLRNQYRFDFVIRAANASRLMDVIDLLREEHVLAPFGKRVTLDVDPVSLL
jgi:primosomal protein N' (replication factor Y)